METLKTSIFSFIVVNLVNKGILHLVLLQVSKKKVGEISHILPENLEGSNLILRKSALIVTISELNFSFKM